MWNGDKKPRESVLLYERAKWVRVSALSGWRASRTEQISVSKKAVLWPRWEAPAWSSGFHLGKSLSTNWCFFIVTKVYPGPDVSPGPVSPTTASSTLPPLGTFKHAPIWSPYFPPIPNLPCLQWDSEKPTLKDLLNTEGLPGGTGEGEEEQDKEGKKPSKGVISDQAPGE